MNPIDTLENHSAAVWWHTKSCATILALIGAIEIYSVMHPSIAMAQYDPLLGISYRLLITVVGMFEIAAAMVLFCRRGNRLALEFLMWIDSVAMTACQDQVDHRAAPARLRMANEQKVLIMMRLRWP